MRARGRVGGINGFKLRKNFSSIIVKNLRIFLTGLATLKPPFGDWPCLYHLILVGGLGGLPPAGIH